MDLYELIFQRRSVRKYADKRLPDELLEKIAGIIDIIEALDGDIKFSREIIKDGQRIQELMSGIIGNYAKVKAPHYLVLSSEIKDGYLENLGYIFEQVILEMTELGLGTCWIGQQVEEKRLKKIINIKAGQEQVVLIAFGYPQNSQKLLRDKTQAKRKKLEKIATGELNQEIKKLIEAAGFAPSAINGQPWFFEVAADMIDLYIPKKNKFLIRYLNIIGHLEQMNQIDAGIALSHLKVAADHFNQEIEIKDVADREKKGYRYIKSIKINK